MQLVVTTPLALILFVAILALGPVRGLWLFFLSMPLGSAAAMNVSGFGAVLLSDFCILALWASLLGRGIGVSRIATTLKPPQPGFALLCLLLIITLGALFLPRVFIGETEVFKVARLYTWDGRSYNAFVLTPLRPLGSNIGQLARMILASSVFVLMATVFYRYGGARQALTAMIVASSVHILVSVADIASYAVGLPDLLDVIRTVNYAILDNQVLLGLKRISGGFPEPSSWAYYTIGLYGFWLRYWFGAQRSRLGGLMLAAIALLMLRSTSSTAYVAGFAFTVLFLSWHLGAIARERKAIAVYMLLTMVMPALFGFAVLAYNFIPAIPEMLDTVLFSKLDSDSGQERMSWNIQALVNFADSYGLGVGIGSVRASSWIMTNLGSLGLIGFAVYIWFLFSALRMRPPNGYKHGPAGEVVAALQAGSAAILLQAMIAKPYPNLEVPFFAMLGIAVGLIRHMKKLNAQTRRPSVGAVPMAPPDFSGAPQTASPTR